MSSNGFIGEFNVLAEKEVIVCGGGPAGLGAALAAARNGADVALLEQSGALGGMASIGLVPCIAYLTDGVNYFARGVCMEIVEEVCRRMGVKEIAPHWQAINAEIVKQVCDEKVAEAGIKVYLNQKVAAASRENGRITALAVAGPNGLKQVRGKVFVDATGDATVAALAGAEFELGDEQGHTMSPSLCVQYAGVDWTEYEKAAAQGRNTRAIWQEFLDRGEAPLPEHHFVGAFKSGPTTATGNLGHIYGANAIDDDDLTRGYTEGRRIARTIHDFFRAHIPGFAGSELVNTASLLSVRETRRIAGDYHLSYKDYLARATFADDIARHCYPVDIHSSTTDPAEQKRVEERMDETRYRPGENYGIPYRALIPRHLDNLLVAGRSISCDREMQSSIRVMPACFLTGQAAGTAAALSVAANGAVRAVDIEQLRRRLRTRLEAFLP